MRRIGTATPEALYGAAATRAIEQAATAALPPHGLMALAGLSIAQLTRALAPHARCIWVACGPGNNGGDGLVAATHLHRLANPLGGSRQVVVTLCADMAHLPPDAAHALKQALAAGVQLSSEPPVHFDVAIDALLGIGQLRPVEGRLAEHLTLLQNTEATVLCVDVPSGLNADTGAHLMGPLTRRHPGARHTLSLLTLKPGLFTANGRDQAGTIWFDDLGVSPPPEIPVHGQLHGMEVVGRPISERTHASHKGSHGDVLVIGGQDLAVNGAGMTGAAILAGRAALHGGAGRVFVSLLGEDSTAHPTGWDPACPELMFRHPKVLAQGELMAQSSVVCGCGGGSSIAAVLPEVLGRAHRLVLDADALNAIAQDSQLQTLLRHRQGRSWITVMTPHPLEAARLLGSSTAMVMGDRLRAARELSDNFAVLCVLKGSGSVICAPDSVPRINPTGNAALATAGTGDVLAGMIGSALAQPGLAHEAVLQRVADAVFQHGWLADRWASGAWPAGYIQQTLTANQLAHSVRPTI